MGENRLLIKLRSLRELPTLPAVLVPLLRHFEKPEDSQDVHEIVRLIGQDKSLAARCLQIANSPLYGASHEIESIQAAVIALGLTKVQEIAVSCSLLKLLPTLWFEVSPSAFWAHSLGCALVARELAVRIGFPDPSKAYAAALLHDVGIVGLLWAAPEDFRCAMRLAQNSHLSLNEAEIRTLGITHEDAGNVLGQSWHLPAELVEVMAYHHDPKRAVHNAELVSIVAMSDLLCRLSGMGYGFPEHDQTDLIEEPGFATLCSQFPALHAFDWSSFTFDMEAVIEEVSATVAQVYGSAP
jgi:HD-like signal output (HDOD) protein